MFYSSVYTIPLTLTALYIVTLAPFVVVLADEYITLIVFFLKLEWLCSHMCCEDMLRHILFILLPLLTTSLKFTNYHTCLQPEQNAPFMH